jgi:hypothetical protein
MKEAARRHQALMRKKEQERRQQFARAGDDGQGIGRSRGLNLSQTPL